MPCLIYSCDWWQNMRLVCLHVGVLNSVINLKNCFICSSGRRKIYFNTLAPFRSGVTWINQGAIMYDNLWLPVCNITNDKTGKNHLAKIFFQEHCKMKKILKHISGTFSIATTWKIWPRRHNKNGIFLLTLKDQKNLKTYIRYFFQVNTLQICPSYKTKMEFFY